MNNFKKFVAVLLGVVMACVFATSAFAADFSNADTAAKAKAEIKAFAASYGITTIDNTVNSLTADQLPSQALPGYLASRAARVCIQSRLPSSSS